MDKNLKKIIIKTKRAIKSGKFGLHISTTRGVGSTFIELREYQYGDDIRFIDWNRTAKEQTPYVKIFNMENELNINIVTILSGSVHFGSNGLFKQELIAHISSILGNVTINQNDNFKSFIANNDFIVNTKRSKDINRVNNMVENILKYNAIGKDINYTHIYKSIIKYIAKKEVLFLVGDFVGYDDIKIKFLVKRYYLFVIIVRDRFEDDPKIMKNTNLIDPIKYNSIDGDIDDKMIDSYKKNIVDNDTRLIKELNRFNIKYTKIYTDEDPFFKIRRLFL